VICRGKREVGSKIKVNYDNSTAWGDVSNPIINALSLNLWLHYTEIQYEEYYLESKIQENGRGHFEATGYNQICWKSVVKVQTSKGSRHIV